MSAPIATSSKVYPDLLTRAAPRATSSSTANPSARIEKKNYQDVPVKERGIWRMLKDGCQFTSGDRLRRILCSQRTKADNRRRKTWTLGPIRTGSRRRTSRSWIKNVCLKCPNKTLRRPPARRKVYESGIEAQKKTLVAYENCIECGAARMLCPYYYIVWVPPRGGFGVQYK